MHILISRRRFFLYLSAEAAEEFDFTEDPVVPLSTDVNRVVVGLDRAFNYRKLQTAQLYLNERNAEFIATNTDRLGNFSTKQVSPYSRIAPGAESCTAFGLGCFVFVVSEMTQCRLWVCRAVFQMRSEVGWCRLHGVCRSGSSSVS